MIWKGNEKGPRNVTKPRKLIGTCNLIVREKSNEQWTGNVTQNISRFKNVRKPRTLNAPRLK